MFLKDPKSLSPALLDPVTHVVGVTASRDEYDALIALARRTTITSERVRYYNAAASARDPSAKRSSKRSASRPPGPTRST